MSYQGIPTGSTNDKLADFESVQGKTLMRRVIVCAAASLAAIATIPVRADDVSARLATCQAIAGESDRLTCYDGLAESLMPVAPAAPAPAPLAEAAPAAAAIAEAVPDPTPEPAPAPAPQTLTDEVAKQEIKGADVERPEYTAKVTRCEELKQQRRMFFVMENGQVWRQSNAGRLKFKAKDCQFDVMLKKDMFGWILHVPSENERVRVKRVR